MGPILSDTTIQHCFGTCVFDGTCPSPVVPSNVTFSVDMNNYSGSQAAGYTVNINGTFNGWCGGCNAMTDSDGDGVWDVTLPLTPGSTIRYKFTVNGWSDQEQFAGGESCTNTNSAGFTDRELIPSSDSTLGVVCFNSCSACPTNDCGVTGTYDYGNNENASNAVGFSADAGDYITLDFTAGLTEFNWDFWFINDAADASEITLATGTGSIVGSYTSTTGEISFYVVSDGSVTGQTFVYSVSCSPPPSCPDPSGLTSSNVTSSSSDFSWTAGGSETAWNIEYGASGFAQGSGTTVAVTTNPYSLTGLTASTSYDVYLQADCGNGDLSQWIGPISITTSCAAASVPYLENFDLGFPACWSQVTTDTWDWTLDANGTPSSNTGPSDDVTGGGNYMFIETSNSYPTGSTASLLSTPLDISTLTIPELRFFSHMYGSQTGTLVVEVFRICFRYIIC